MQPLGQLGDDEPVPHQIFLEIGPVLLPLGLEGGPLPGGLSVHLPLGQHPPGEVEAAVFVAAGAQGLLRGGQLPRREHGHAETVFHIVPQHLLPGPPLAQVEPGAFSARKISGRPPLPDRRRTGPGGAGRSLAPAAPLLVPVEHIPPGPGGPLAVGDAPPGAAEVAVEQGLHPVLDLLLVQLRGKGEGVQHSPLPVVLRPGLPQGPLEPGTAEVVQALPDSLVPAPGPRCGRRIPAAARPAPACPHGHGGKPPPPGPARTGRCTARR